MEKENPEQPQRIVKLADEAVIDLVSIDSATSAMWGEDQAERYLGFLQEVFSMLLAEPTLGKIIEQRPEYRVFIAKYSKKRNVHEI